MKLMLLGREFEIDPTDCPQACLYKALVTLEEGEAAESKTLFAALKDGHFSESALRQALSYATDFILRRQVPQEHSTRKVWLYCLDRGVVKTFTTIRAMTKKQRAEHHRTTGSTAYRRHLKYG